MPTAVKQPKKNTHCFSYNFEVESDADKVDPTFERDAAQILIAMINKLTVSQVASNLEHWDTYDSN